MADGQCPSQTAGPGRCMYWPQSSKPQCAGSSTSAPFAVSRTYGRSSSMSDESYAMPYSASRSKVRVLGSQLGVR